ncbi:MAG: PEP-CTERM system TPR-repeat protein PrsT, partial [Chromatiaceae bacterium]|nr:PEP-CTERM system TPR-repeat protein PrsT [Chromatiaceae bacterium]
MTSKQPSRRHRLSSFLTVVLFSTAVLAADPQAVSYYEDAVSRFNAGDAEGALIQLKNALQRDPGQLSAKILTGRTYLALGEPRLAEEELLQAQKLGADPLLVALPLARARNEIGKYDENIHDIVPIQFPHSLQPDLWVELGLARLYKDDPDGATIAFGEALKIDPAHAGGRLGMARIPLEAKDFVAAERLAGDILATDPQAPDAWYIKGAAAHAQGRFSEAAEAYGKAYELDPKHLQAAVGEATALLEAGKPATAAALLKPLREKHPGSATIPYLQSEALKAMGRKEDADAARATAAAIINRFAPEDVKHRPGDLLLFGTIAFESGQLETAFKFLSPYVETGGADIQGRKMLAKTLLALGKPGDAQRVLTRISAAQQADAETLALLGDTNVQLGDLPAAERYYRDALQNHNGGPAVLRRLGMTQFQSGRRDQALGTLEALVDNTKGAASADTALLLGLLYYSEDRFNEAGGIAERLTEENPKNYTARNLLGLVTLAKGDALKGREILEAVVTEEPNFRPARYNLIKLDIAQGRDAAAATALQEMIARDPKDVRALLESARFAQARGDQRVAIAHLEKIRELEPKNILAMVELINAYLATDQVPQALNRAVELDRAVPNTFVVKDAVARAQIAGGATTDAAITLKEVNRLASDDPERLIY